MRRLFPYVAVSMVYLMMPGSGELAENVVHLLAHGHAAHAIDDAEHEPQGDEHGCSGLFHVCPCHSSIGFALGAGYPSLGSTLTTGERAFAVAEDTGADGHFVGLFRPPIA